MKKQQELFVSIVPPSWDWRLPELYSLEDKEKSKEKEEGGQWVVGPGENWQLCEIFSFLVFKLAGDYIRSAPSREDTVGINCLDILFWICRSACRCGPGESLTGDISLCCERGLSPGEQITDWLLSPQGPYPVPPAPASHQSQSLLGLLPGPPTPHLHPSQTITIPLHITTSRQ